MTTGTFTVLAGAVGLQAMPNSGHSGGAHLYIAGTITDQLRRLVLRAAGSLGEPLDGPVSLQVMGNVGILRWASRSPDLHDAIYGMLMSELGSRLCDEHPGGLTSVTEIPPNMEVQVVQPAISLRLVRVGEVVHYELNGNLPLTGLSLALQTLLEQNDAAGCITRIDDDAVSTDLRIYINTQITITEARFQVAAAILGALFNWMAGRTFITITILPD
ncbi:MAG TPA: hypothetical protein VI322_03005 [Candidatus Saccharimonadia bacterium]